MELFYFTLGVLSVFALIIIGVLILGMFRVSKVQKEITSLKESFKWENEQTKYLINDTKRISNGDIDNVYRNLDEKIEKLYLDMERSFNDSTSYTDKRIDKAIFQYKES